MSQDKPPQDKIKPFSTLQGGKKQPPKRPQTTPKDKNPPARHQIYVSDAQFKRAMELIREDMNRALQLGQIANTQYYLLVKFLAEKGLIEEGDLSRFIQEKMAETEREKNRD